MLSLVKRCDDVCQCPLCNGTLKQPKSLPCLHIFCQHCLLAHGSKNGGVTIVCPVCDKEAPVPAGGCEQLPTAFFVQKLLDELSISKVDRQQNVQCDLCIDEDNEGDHVSLESVSLSTKEHASLHCFNCNQNLCEPCGRRHKRQTVCKDHVVMELGGSLGAEQLKKFDSSQCVLHKEELIKLYCLDCRLLVCFVCFAEHHNTHNCKYIDNMTDEFNNLLDSDIVKVSSHAEKCDPEMKSMEEHYKSFTDLMDRIEKDIKAKGEHVKRLVDEEVGNLLDQTKAITKKHELDVEKLTIEVKGHLLSLKSYVSYATELKNKGTNVDIARVSTELQTRANELVTLDVTPSRARLNEVKVRFIPVNIAQMIGGSTTSIIGSIYVQKHKQGRPWIVISNGAQVRGLTTILDRLYVARSRCPDIEVYDSQTMALLRTLKVTDCNPCDMTSDMSSKLIISDYHASLVFVVDMNCVSPPTKWSTVDKPDGVSTICASNSSTTILVTCRDARKIREFDLEGAVIHEICMQGDIKTIARFRHSLRLGTSEKYVVCVGFLGGHQILILDRSGKIIKNIPAANQLDAKMQLAPTHMANDSKGNVYVADPYVKRVLRMNFERQEAKEIIAPDAGIIHPFRLHLDESRGLLFVGERADVGRVWAIKIM